MDLDTDLDEVPFRSCRLCGHSHAERHRLIPGEWGGDYSDHNVIELCPNHHTAIHYLMKWYLASGRRKRDRNKDQDDARLMAYFSNGPIRDLWGLLVKPIVIEKLRSEGHWHPYTKCDFRTDDLLSVRDWQWFEAALDRRFEH